MKLREITADDLGKSVSLKARHVDVTGRLEAYSHQAGAFTEARQGRITRSSVETSLTIAGHDFDFGELLDAEIEVHP